MDWPELVKALGILLVGVLGAVTALVVRGSLVRSKVNIDTRQADAKIEREREARQQRSNKVAADQWRELAEHLQERCESTEGKLVDTNNKAQLLATEVALLGYQVKQLTIRVDECEADRRELRKLLHDRDVIP